MHSFSTTVTVPSVSLPGVSIKVRRLSSQARANRDLKILDAQLRFTELNERIQLLSKPHADAPELTLTVALEITRHDREMGCIINSTIKPATIRAGFVSAEGIAYDGKPATADLILDNGPDSLIDEIWLAIDKHAQLSTDEKKDSESSGTSSAPKAPETSSSTANAASATASGNLNAETAGATSPNP